MPRGTLTATLATSAVCLFAATATAQATAPLWSTYLGGSATDEICAVRFGPGQLVTVAGYTASPGLATLGAFQPSIAGAAGDYDAFVARFDPSLPPTQQLLWFTYLGGSDLDQAFDLQVDAQGITTVVGVTASGNFPTLNAGLPSLQGASDGFVTQIAPNGSALVYSTYFGGNLNDRICDVVLDPNGTVLVAGNTESNNLPATANTVWPTYHGGPNDGFVARLDPSAAGIQQFVWSTYLGGSAQEGMIWSVYIGNGGPNGVWPGNLQRTAIAVEPGGNVVATTVTRSFNAPTTPGCYQPGNAGSGDVYLVRLNPGATIALYATCFGDTAQESPKALDLHPAGGIVLGGNTSSSNMPVTLGCFQATNQFGTFGNSNDGFLCWIDPAGNGTQDLRYSTYFGGNGGEDSVLAMVIENSGVVTVAGYLSGGNNFPTTPRGLLPTTSGSQYCGMVARIELAGQGADDLHHATHIGGSWTVMSGLDLDEAGNAIFCGATDTWAYPLVNPYQVFQPGGFDGCITYMPMLPGGADRADFALATPACSEPLYTGMVDAPVGGRTNFGVTATNAPPLAPGLLALGVLPTPAPSIVLNATLLITPQVTDFVIADTAGYVRYDIPLPAVMPPPPSFEVQWFFLTNPACPGSGILAASERLVF